MQLSESEDDDGEKVARLASVPIPSPDSDLCMSFWYHMFGEHAGALHVKLRMEGEGGRVLWTVRGHQGSQWKEGRVLLPHASVSYQVSRSPTPTVAPRRLPLMPRL